MRISPALTLNQFHERPIVSSALQYSTPVPQDASAFMYESAAVFQPLIPAATFVSVEYKPNAYMSLAESKQHKSVKDYSKVNGLITEIICNATGVCPLC